MNKPSITKTKQIINIHTHAKRIKIRANRCKQAQYVCTAKSSCEISKRILVQQKQAVNSNLLGALLAVGFFLIIPWP